MKTKKKSSGLTPQAIQSIRHMLSKSGELSPQEVEKIMRHMEAPEQTILARMQMLGEDQIPQRILDKYLPTPQERHIFTTVADPDRWPKTMQPFRKWIDQHVPPRYWAAED